MTEQPEDEIRHRSEESDRGKTSPEENLHEYLRRTAIHRDSQSVEEEGQVWVELVSSCAFDAAVDP